MSDKKLLLTSYKGYEAAYLLNDRTLLQFDCNHRTNYQIGDIFVGKVERVLPSIQAAFVNFTKDDKGFLPLSNVREEAIINRTGSLPLKGGDEVLVQVLKEPIKTKDAMLTCELTLQSENFVFIPYGSGMHFSKKLTKEQKDCLASQLNELIQRKQEHSDILCTQFGLIVRTNAAYCNLDVLESELDSLFAEAKHILRFAKTRTIYSKIYTNHSFYTSCVQNYKGQEDVTIITDIEILYDSLKNDIPGIRLYQDDKIDLFHLYGLESQMDQALAKKVWLKSGGYLIIEPTEALTVIDVNSGKAAGHKDMESFHLKTNLEAACEIARQLRLRNISGIIVIDFINLSLEESKTKLVNVIKDAIKADPIETVFVDMTKLGLIELTRKKTTASLREKLYEITKSEEDL